MASLEPNIESFLNACIERNLNLAEMNVTFQTLNSNEYIRLNITADWFNKEKISADIEKLITIFKKSTSEEFQKKVHSLILIKKNSINSENEEIVGFRALGVEH